MTATTRLSAAFALLAAGATPIWADCGIEAGSVRILSNDFPAITVINDVAMACASDKVTVTKNQTTEHQALQVAALSVNPATYSVAVVATDSIVPLMNDGLIRPLDDYVAKYGQDLQESQLIRIDGKIMAVAFMINAQHLFYRKDVLDKAGIAPPKTYEDVLAAAEKLRGSGAMQYPFAANYKAGWNLAAEFVNIYTGLGGELFEAGGATPAIDNETGLKTLETMKSLAGYMNPDYLTYDTNTVVGLWQAGEAAVIDGWGSRASTLIDPAGPAPDIAAATVIAAAPTVGGGTIPAATMWWDGFVIAKNIPDEDAEASFRAMIHAVSPATAAANPATSAWLMKGYTPTPAAEGVMSTLAAGGKPYPMVPYMGVMHTALGDNLAEFLQGQESAEQALADVTAAYTTAAREAGFLE